jgi:hypothetical protein
LWLEHLGGQFLRDLSHVKQTGDESEGLKSNSQDPLTDDTIPQQHDRSVHNCL